MTTFKNWYRGRLLLLAAFAVAVGVPARAAEEQAEIKKKPKVEVVFCLDTTGSMGGLIEAAKRKIWGLSNQIAGGTPTPELKIGLVAFRDRGDEYLTKVVDLTDDLDAVYSKLKEFRAAGGGDEPESVNQALDDAVNKIKWNQDKETLRIIFLVGDAPPHMDYANDVKYPETCKKAVEKGIIVNSIQCGPNPRTRAAWQDICRKAEGSYVQIAQDGGVVAVATPFDKRLAEINGELTRTTLTYGDRLARERGETLKSVALGLSAPAAAERAGFAGKSGKAATFDLLDGIKDGKVKLEELKKDELPVELQTLSLKEQKEFLDKLDKRRADLNQEVLQLDKQRTEFLNQKLAETIGKSGFDQQVLEIVRRQAKRHNIEY